MLRIFKSYFNSDPKVILTEKRQRISNNIFDLRVEVIKLTSNSIILRPFQSHFLQV